MTAGKYGLPAVWRFVDYLKLKVEALLASETSVPVYQ
jgi:hypothetical protein